jgi:hypothetical protein
VYHVPDQETTDPEPTVPSEPPPPPPPPAAEIAAHPMPGTRWNSLLVGAALVALILLILTALL